MQASLKKLGASMSEEDKVSGKQAGGIARAHSLTPNERRSIARKAAIARWRGVKDSLPSATKECTLDIGDVTFDCYLLKDRRRVISQRGMARALKMKSEGGNVFKRTLARKALGSEIPEKLREKLENPIYFLTLSQDPAYGYEAITLIEVCDAIWEADRKKLLPKSQKPLAMQAEIIVRSSAKIGIVALIDEALGIDDKGEYEYRELFREFIREEFSQWNKEFPDEWLNMWYRLYNMRRISKTKHPKFFGKLVRKYIYAPLANSNGAILEILDEKNPIVYKNGGRRYKMFQFLSDEIGLPAFRAHLWKIIGIGSAAKTKESFEKLFSNAFPQSGHQLGLDLDDDC